MGDKILTKKCRQVEEVTPRIRQLVEDMLDTMYDACGVGLAAPQVGILKRIVVIDVGEGPLVLINPAPMRQRVRGPPKADRRSCAKRSFWSWTAC